MTTLLVMCLPTHFGTTFAVNLVTLVFDLTDANLIWISVFPIFVEYALTK